MDLLKKQQEAVFITEVLAISSQSLKYLEPDLHKEANKVIHAHLGDLINAVLFARIIQSQMSALLNLVLTLINGKLRSKPKQQEVTPHLIIDKTFDVKVQLRISSQVRSLVSSKMH